MSLFPKPYADRVARLRVTTGFLLALAFAWFSQPDVRSLAWGLPLSLVGLLLRGWAAGHLEKNIRLADSGPYAFVRNPLYIGTLLVAAGLLVASQRWVLAFLFVAMFGLIYLPVIELEEQHLSNLFPEFAQYAKRVPALWPAWSGSTGAHRSFQWSLYVRNREYQALLGFLTGTALLIAKVMVLPSR
ncbi:MAG TPA: methyltransferase [Bryobacteraceae bacterium]|nr:methyltransferase [Bryobacteraceae bacterium]